MITTTTHTTTWWYGINSETNFCAKCGCSVNYETFKKDWNIYDDTFICKCGWIGTYDTFLKNRIEALKIQRKDKIEKIEKNEN